MRVWVDQSRCQNSGLCEEEAPMLFKVGDDFLAYVRHADGGPGDPGGLGEPGGEQDQAEVPADLEELAEACARACPAQCIHLVS